MLPRSRQLRRSVRKLQQRIIQGAYQCRIPEKSCLVLLQYELVLKISQRLRQSSYVESTGSASSVQAGPNFLRGLEVQKVH